MYQHFLPCGAQKLLTTCACASKMKAMLAPPTSGEMCDFTLGESDSIIWLWWCIHCHRRLSVGGDGFAAWSDHPAMWHFLKPFGSPYTRGRSQAAGIGGITDSFRLVQSAWGGGLLSFGVWIWLNQEDLTEYAPPEKSLIIRAQDLSKRFGRFPGKGGSPLPF